LFFEQKDGETGLHFEKVR